MPFVPRSLGDGLDRHTHKQKICAALEATQAYPTTRRYEHFHVVVSVYKTLGIFERVTRWLALVFANGIL